MRNVFKKKSVFIPSPVGRAGVGVLFLLLPFTFYAQSNVFPTSGNVGIGLTNPAYNLDIRTDNPVLQMLENSSGGRRRLLFNVGGNNEISIISSYGNSGNFPLTFRFGGSVGEVMRMATNGNIGIGTANPQSKLEIYKRGDGASLLKFNTDRPWEFVQTGVSGATGLALRSTVNSKPFRIQSPGGITNATFYTNDTPASNRIYLLQGGGRVGIGTTAPDAELTVKGKIHTQEVKVDLAGAVAPDYVFKEDYPLRSLEEVQAHIKEKGHLPGIPSAEEMEEEGINLKEMNLKLLEKVEELTLYTLQQQTDLSRKDKRINDLESRLETLEKLLLNKN